MIHSEFFGRLQSSSQSGRRELRTLIKIEIQYTMDDGHGPGW